MNEENSLDDFIEDFREYVLDAMDVATVLYGIEDVTDDDLPELFKTLDALATKLWNRCVA